MRTASRSPAVRHHIAAWFRRVARVEAEKGNLALAGWLELLADWLDR